MPTDFNTSRSRDFTITYTQPKELFYPGWANKPIKDFSG